MWLGHIQFTVIGGSSDSKPAHQDENAVQFDKSRRGEFERVKLIVEERIRALRTEQRSGPVSAPGVGTGSPQGEPDIFEAIQKLGSLRDSGLITPQEFETKKAELLSRL